LAFVCFDFVHKPTLTLVTLTIDLLRAVNHKKSHTTASSSYTPLGTTMMTIMPTIKKRKATCLGPGAAGGTCEDYLKAFFKI
jgi:hypothetical protein